MKSLTALLILSLLLCITPVFAQAQDFGYGVPVTGTLNDATPQIVYTFAGLRGDVIAIDLTVNSGNLDPMLALLDSSGSVIAVRDDAALSGRPSGDLHLQALHIPRTDRYSLVVARFGYGLGTTSGQYTLKIDRVGVSSASGSALRYGDSVYNTITDGTPQVYYSFRAQRGDVITVRMQRASGDLDPMLQLVNSQEQVIAENDDSPGTLDAAISGYIIRADGQYAIIASRFGQAAGRSKGAFVLTLAAGADNGLGRSIDFALPILNGVPVQGEITDKYDAQFYSFEGKRDDVVTIRMSRTGGALDSFLSLLDPSRRELTNDDDSGGGQDAMIDHYILPMDGTYIIVATRYEQDKGTSVGPYQLSLDVSGSAFQNVIANALRMEYNTTVNGKITEEVPQVLYVFVGQKGDTLSIAMNRADGNLDARLIVLDAAQRPIASDDDSGGHQNALINALTLPSAGVYYIVATRFSGSQGNDHTTGSYTLSVAQKTG